MSFKVGDTVVWHSQAGGIHTQKRGKIVAHVPQGDMPHPVHTSMVKKYNARSTFDPRCGARKEDGFFVLVPPKTDRGRPILYWPRLVHLRKEN